MRPLLLALLLTPDCSLLSPEPIHDTDSDASPADTDDDPPVGDTDGPVLDGVSDECILDNVACQDTLQVGARWLRDYSGRPVELWFMPEGSLSDPSAWITWTVLEVAGQDTDVGGSYVETPPLEAVGRFAVALVGVDDENGADFTTLAPCPLQLGPTWCARDEVNPPFEGYDPSRMLLVTVEAAPAP